jgi:DNA-binding NarL/FixJ family response regulator
MSFSHARKRVSCLILFAFSSLTTTRSSARGYGAFSIPMLTSTSWPRPGTVHRQGYLLKNVEPAELVGAIRAAARGHATLHPSVAARLMHAIDHPGDDSLTNLSERELDVLRLVARGMSNREIAESLTISECTVKSHVSNILSKLQLAHRTQAALHALKRGLVPFDDAHRGNH